MNSKNAYKIAYIMLCHDDAEMVARTVEALHYEDDKMFIHVDKKSDDRPFKKLMGDKDNCVFINNRVENYWGGGYNSIRATMECIKAAVEKDDYDRFILLQGKDYPLVSPQEIHQFFIKHISEEFCKAKDITVSKERKDYMKCCGYWYQDVGPSLVSKVIRHYLKVLNVKIGIRYRKGYFKYKKEIWHVYKGWAQFVITGECAKYVLNIYNNNLKYNKFMKHRFPPDEIYVHTIIHNSPFRANVSDYSILFREDAEWRDDYLNLTYFEYPVQVTVFKSKDDYKWLHNTGALFFRKATSNESGELLDYVDTIIGRT